MTRFPDLFAALAAPFENHEVKTRTAPGGRSLSYITARTAMIRLDNVLGPENWWDEYVPLEHSVICKLTIQIVAGDGEVVTVTKCDAGGYAGMADQGDDDKSGFSDAFKRACAKFGVGRYLYRDGVPSFVRQREPDASPPGPRGGPAPAPGPQPPRRESNGPGPGGGAGGVPRTGKALFAWVKDQEARHGVDLLKYLNGWGKFQEFPGRMIDWDAEQVKRGHDEALRKIAAAGPGPEEGPEGDEPARGGPAAADPARPAGPPRTGKALYSWALNESQRTGSNLVQTIKQWAEDRGIPGRMIDWTGEDVAAAHAAAAAYLETLS